MRRRSRWSALGRGFVLTFVAVLALYAVGRAVFEIVTVDPGRPESYAQDWGGPHYLGVLAVHAGPGVLAATLLLLWARRATRRPGRDRR